MRVLYVDDDRVNALLFAETCRSVAGVEVETADSGTDALDLIAGWRPDLLVIDLHLPDTDGYRLLPALRECVGERLPAYLCSADEAPLVEAPARAAGFDGCWCKPADPAALRAALEAHRRRAA